MPACCAKNCRNRAEQGFRLFRFPRDKQRKEIWSKQCNTYPKENSRLCEFHFDDSQFEGGRQDGWRKLKPNAIPTIFVNEEIVTEGLRDETESSATIFSEEGLRDEIVSSATIFSEEGLRDEIVFSATIFSEEGPRDETEPIATILSEENVINDTNVQHDDRQPVFVSADTGTQTEEDSNVTTFQTAYYSNNNGTIRQANLIKYFKKELVHTQQKNNILKSKLGKERLLRLKAEKHTNAHIKAYKNLKKKYATLSKKLEEMPILKQFASELIGSQSKWSPECLKLATQIRYAVGWKAYLYLKKDMGLPLPSYSTLCKHINKLDFSPGVLKDVISLMEKKRKTHKSSHQSDCVLLMDEMDIQKTLEYDVSTAHCHNTINLLVVCRERPV
ncbi:uncharacterized protein [Temnothorax nylanderi]|uniref:uncharacterized protein isoform X2 n=1 Tax=Temnothorax nylanderi TaxID=102681 RepID=UPI003A84DB08